MVKRQLTGASNLLPLVVDDLHNVAIDLDVPVGLLSDLQGLDQGSRDGILQNLDVREVQFGESHPALRRHGDHLLDHDHQLQGRIQDRLSLVIGPDFELGKEA